MTNDQYTFDNPKTRYDALSPPGQHQPEPGLDSRLRPRPDLGEESYRGTGRLTGRRALITGADSGIGAAVAIAFAREGADVALAYLPSEESDATRIAELVRSAGREAVLLPCDISVNEECTRLVDDAANALGGLDILVNNAGKQVYCEKLEDLADDAFDATMRTNVYAMFWITKAALKHLPAGSSIINTTSVQAYKPSPILVDYATTKAAINAFTKALGAQLAERGIRVNAVAPGPVWTVLQVTDGQPPEKIAAFGHDTPLGRAAQPAEMAPAYVFLASSESSYVIGETLNANGGMPTP
ncbi:SDR family oxidoreductase [Microterricola pindariensis]|uniref:NAD(P)-dependent oxidoreductase n=1 Tax=Microterricola pindariensis TaxID=478010 RepID=A0ABX5B010_9MICO|nr:SDR family oxidoreductase [Microterricola pindariensis]PPL19924.1 NAD(P)-dependent oxidoreductase [Microterricola pindariensis]